MLAAAVDSGKGVRHAAPRRFARTGTRAVTTARQRLFALFDQLGIRHRTFEHPPVFTVAEAEAHTAHLPGAHTKNLFLEDRAGGLWLVSCLADQRVRVNALARLLRAPRMAFAKPERLLEVLGVVPGAVTPFALINDVERRVRPVVDEKLLRYPEVNFHPVDNAATTTIASSDLLAFMTALDYVPLLIDLDVTLAEDV